MYSSSCFRPTTQSSIFRNHIYNAAVALKVLQLVAPQVNVKTKERLSALIFEIVLVMKTEMTSLFDTSAMLYCKVYNQSKNPSLGKS